MPGSEVVFIIHSVFLPTPQAGLALFASLDDYCRCVYMRINC